MVDRVSRPDKMNREVTPIPHQSLGIHVLLQHTSSKSVESKKLGMAFQVIYETGDQSGHLRGTFAARYVGDSADSFHNRYPTLQEYGCKDLLLGLEVEIHSPFG